MLNIIILLIVQIGSYVAKCDEQFTLDEQQRINEYVSRICNLQTISTEFRNQITDVLNSSFTLDQVTASMDYVLNFYNTDNERHLIITCVDQYIRDIASVDNNLSDAENNFYNTWRQRYQ